MKAQRAIAVMCAIAAIVLSAADARAHAVLLHNRCTGVRLQALLEQLRVVEAEVRSAPGPEPSASEITQWLMREAGGVVVIVDPACHARVYGVHGEYYEVSSDMSTRAWAVRIAELAYALSPYDVQQPPFDATLAMASSPAPEPPPDDPGRQARQPKAWSAGVGPALWWLSGTDTAMAALGMQLVWRRSPYLALTVRGSGSLSRASIGPSTRRALARLLYFGAGPRLSLPLGDTVSLDLSVTYGALWVYAQGHALPPLGNRGDQTWASMAAAGFGASYSPTTTWGARCEASIGRALPTVRVVLGDEEQEVAALALALEAAIELQF